MVKQVPILEQIIKPQLNSLGFKKKRNEIYILEDFDGSKYEVEDILYQNIFENIKIDISYHHTIVYDTILKYYDLQSEYGERVHCLIRSDEIVKFIKKYHMKKNKNLLSYYQPEYPIPKKYLTEILDMSGESLIRVILETEEDGKIVDSMFGNPFVQIKTQEILKNFNMLNSIEGIYDFIFKTEMKLFINNHISLFVFLYLSFKQGWNAKKTFNEYNLPYIQRFFDKDLDIKKILHLEFFEDCYIIFKDTVRI